jgi:hypothetical protein
MKPTVSKEIYKRLSQNGGWVPSGEMEKWHCLDATGSTITRKARLLEADSWIAVRYVNGCAEYRALQTKDDRNAYTPADGLETPNLALRDELPPEAPKGHYEPTVGPDGRRVARWIPA